jgi:hypothetical protein
MPEYSYRFANLLSDSDIAELELSNVKFDRRIITPGAFSGSIAVTNSDTATQVKKIIPARTIVHVYRDADIWGTYIIWSMRVRSSPRGPVNVEFTGASLESWFYKRIVDVDLSFTGEDQFDIARELVANAQIGWTPYADSADLNVIAQSNLSGTERDRSYYVTDAVSVGQRLEELANVDNGFEYMISTYVDADSGSRIRELVLAEELGAGNTNFVFTYPGSILNYELNFDASEAGTAFWARGATIGDDITQTSAPLMTEAPVLSSDWLDNSFPHMDKVIDYPSVTVLLTLEDYAAYWRDNRSGVWAVPIFEINTSDVPSVLPPSALGSYAQYTIQDEMFGLTDTGPEFSYRNRIVGIEVSPPDRGQTETVRFVVSQAFDPTDTGE